jgi:hypothetical protein
MRYGGYSMTLEDLNLKQAVASAAKVFGFKKVYFLEDHVFTREEGEDYIILVIDDEKWDKSRLFNGDLESVGEYLEDSLDIPLVLVRTNSLDRDGILYLDREICRAEAIYE